MERSILLRVSKDFAEKMEQMRCLEQASVGKRLSMVDLSKIVTIDLVFTPPPKPIHRLKRRYKYGFC